MGHIDHQPGPDLVGDLAEAGEVDDAGVGAGARHDELWPVRLGQLPIGEARELTRDEMGVLLDLVKM